MTFKKGEMLGAMIHLAVDRHKGQYDRSGRPYILHPLKVMELLESDEEELQVIAVGHDIVEDTPTTYQELRELGFSERVVEAIRALTKIPGQTYEEYQAGVFANRDAMLVKAAEFYALTAAEQIEVFNTDFSAWHMLHCEPAHSTEEGAECVCSFWDN